MRCQERAPPWASRRPVGRAAAPGLRGGPEPPPFPLGPHGPAGTCIDGKGQVVLCLSSSVFRRAFSRPPVPSEGMLHLRALYVKSGICERLFKLTSREAETGQGIVHALTDLSSPGMTSGNGNSASSIAGTAPQNGENKPPQAIVKPQILTHVIEGFVIQEGAEPFPVGRSSLLVGNLKKKYAQGFLPEKLPQQDHTTTTDSEMEEPYLQESKEEGTPLKLKCELCGRVDFAYKFKRSKRFCSMACAKRYNVGCTKRVGLFHSDRSKLQKAGTTTHNRRRASKASLPTLTKDTKKQPSGTVPLSVTAALQLAHSQEDSSRCSDNSSYEEPLSPISASSSTSRRRQGQRDLELSDMHMRDLVGMGHHFLPSEPTKWNVEDVYEFIRSLPGCQEIAEEFRAQEIDGQALLLLKEDHLMSAMNIKLGPALKIYARISMLKDS